MTVLSKSARVYLDGIDASGLIRTRVDLFVELYDALYADGVFTNTFISDAVNEEGERSWKSLWLWGPELMAECKNFLFIEDWDCAPIGNVKVWAATSHEYKPDSISADSRIQLKFYNNQSVSGTMTGTGDNCVGVTKFLREALVPRLARDAAQSRPVT